MEYSTCCRMSLAFQRMVRARSCLQCGRMRLPTILRCVSRSRYRHTGSVSLLSRFGPRPLRSFMYKGNRITVVIPCLNEEGGIQLVLGALPNFVDEVIVVDNNST